MSTIIVPYFDRVEVELDMEPDGRGLQGQKRRLHDAAVIRKSVNRLAQRKDRLHRTRLLQGRASKQALEFAIEL